MGIVLGVYADERVFPFDGGKGPRQTLLDVPEDGPPQIDVVLDQPHAAISWPATFVVVADDIIVSRVGVGTEVPLYEVSRFVGGEAEQNVQFIDVAGVETDRMADFGGRITVLEEIVGHLGRTSHLAGTLETEDEEIHNEAVVLENKRGELQSTDEAVGVRVGHVFIGQDRVVLGCNVVGQVVVQDESEETLQEGKVDLLVNLGKLSLH